VVVKRGRNGNLANVVERLTKEIQAHIDLLDVSRKAYLELNDNLDEFRSFLHKDAVRCNKHLEIIHDLANKALNIATEKLSSVTY
jgi:histone H3/H4